MRVYRFWAQHREPGDRWPVRCWGASETSADEARANAADIERRVESVAQAGGLGLRLYRTASRFRRRASPLKTTGRSRSTGSGSSATTSAP